MPDPFLSVVIPLGPDEAEVPQGLIDDLHFLPQDSEIIFVGCDPEKQAVIQAKTEQRIQAYPVSWVYSSPGRAVQMNTAATQARGKFIWFLHVDSRFQPELIDALVANMYSDPECMHYCLLEFAGDGPAPMAINGLGANIRSVLLSLPFGDQGLAVSRHTFVAIGGYPEHVPCGEDHILVWRARQQGIKLKCCYSYLRTSARRYQRKGWLALTLRYQKLWIKQAWPEFIRLWRKRYF